MSTLGRLVWVTGARGMLGSELVRNLAVRGHEVLATGREADIADRERLLVALAGRRPRCIINAAAYTAVDLAESESTAAFRINAEGAGIIAELARDIAADFVHVSTDYVFEGLHGEPIKEDAPLAPRGVYAQSKALGEARVLATIDAAHRVIVVRTSWLFGPHPRSFVARMLSLMARRETLDVVADQYGRPTAAVDLADVLVMLGIGELQTIPSGAYHFANPGATTWHGFATAIQAAARHHGQSLATTSIRPIATSAFPRPAPRPAWSVLDCTTLERALADCGRPARSWLSALDELLGRAP